MLFDTLFTDNDDLTCSEMGRRWSYLSWQSLLSLVLIVIDYLEIFVVFLNFRLFLRLAKEVLAEERVTHWFQDDWL